MATIAATTNTHAPSRGDGWLSGLTRAYAAWRIAARERRECRRAAAELHRLSARELNDMGLTRSEIDTAVRMGRPR
ncbi:MAG: DUF1127 domain-containing protein [Pseudomonadota bacterium]